MVACWLPEEFAALTDEWSAEEITAAARAQANWLETLRRQDPRIVEQSEPISPEDLRSALRVMRSLFDWNTNPDLTLAGAMFWAGLLLDLNAAAEVRGETSPLPLPPLWLSRGELDMIERWDEVGKAECESGDEEGTGDDAEWPARHAQKPLRACAFPARRPRTLAAMPQPAAHSPSKVDESDGTSA